jgi:hypothetical protein
MKFILKLVGLVVMAWLLLGLPLALVWLLFDWDWDVYWTLFFFISVYFLMYTAQNNP